MLMRHLPDHGLPLVQLKEQRRDLVVAMQKHQGPISGWELMQIAAVQQAISAFEAVIADLDAEAEMELGELTDFLFGLKAEGSEGQQSSSLSDGSCFDGPLDAVSLHRLQRGVPAL